jgi:hypothetical protein
MKKRRYEDGGLTDAMEMANSSEESQAIANETMGDTMLKSMRDEAAKPKPRPRPKAKPMSFAEKAKKANFTSAETGGGAALMYRKPMAKGGMTASKRADGCCIKGKTRGKMV